MKKRDATNRLRFVHFQVNRRQGYVGFLVLGFLNEENDFTQVSKNLSGNIIQIDLKIFRYLRKTVSFV